MKRMNSDVDEGGRDVGEEEDEEADFGSVRDNNLKAFKFRLGRAGCCCAAGCIEQQSVRRTRFV